MAIVASEDGDIVMQDPLSQESSIVTEVEHELVNSEGTKQIVRTMKLDKSTTKGSRANDSKLQKDMETCFGFDEVITKNLSINFIIYIFLPKR